MRQLLGFTVAGGLMGLLFYLSSQSTTGLDILETGTAVSLALRKLGHAVAFGVLALSSRVAFGPLSRAGLSSYGLALTLAVAYAIGDEVHQRYTPGRAASPADVAIDAAGAVAALALWKLTERRLAPGRTRAPAHRGDPS